MTTARTRWRAHHRLRRGKNRSPADTPPIVFRQVSPVRLDRTRRHFSYIPFGFDLLSALRSSRWTASSEEAVDSACPSNRGCCEGSIRTAPLVGSRREQRRQGRI